MIPAVKFKSLLMLQPQLNRLVYLLDMYIHAQVAIAVT